MKIEVGNVVAYSDLGSPYLAGESDGNHFGTSPAGQEAGAEGERHAGLTS